MCDVSATNSYAGYTTSLRQANLTPYNAVTFRIKGASGGEKVKIGLRDSMGNEPKIVLSEYLPGGITTSWQKVTIPLRAFTSVADWSHMDSVVFAFENRIGSGAGSIFLDDIKFEMMPFTLPVVVDNFNDMSGENGLGGSLWVNAAPGATINAAYDTMHAYKESGAGYRVAYRATPSAWATAGTDLMGLDASTALTLSFVVKGERGGERGHIYLASRTSGAEIRRFVELTDYITVTTAWQKVNIPLSVFRDQGVDLSNLAYFQVVFEWENMEGTIYLDDIQIGSSSVLEDVDGDGKADILWRHTSGAVYVWLLNGTSLIGAESPGGATTDWQIQ